MIALPLPLSWMVAAALAATNIGSFLLVKHYRSQVAAVVAECRADAQQAAAEAAEQARAALESAYRERLLREAELRRRAENAAESAAQEVSAIEAQHQATRRKLRDALRQTVDDCAGRPIPDSLLPQPASGDGP